MPNYSTDLDRVFHALSDPTRREVLAMLSNEGSSSMTELAEPFAMALPSFAQHMKLLEECGLVTSSKSGRVRTFELSPEPLARAESWIGEQRRLWETRLDQLDDYVRSLNNPTKRKRK